MANNEVQIKDGTVLITITDKKGRINYANDAFVTFSGYSRGEIMGKEHNMLHHPDMPAAVFQELWSDVKELKPWKRLMKYRCKNGDYYWEETSLTPVYENAVPIGYMWVGYAPSREQISQAERLYRNITEGKIALESSGWRDKLNFLGRLNLKQKFVLVGFGLCLPIAILTFLLISEKNKAINFAEKELLGSELLVSVGDLLVDMGQHRGLTNMYLNGNTAVRPKILSKQKQIANDMQVLAANNQQVAEILDTSTRWQEIEQSWDVLKEAVRDSSASDSFSQHTELIATILAFVNHIGDTSNLILDPDIDSYYMMSTVVLRVPELIEKVGVFRGRMAGLMAKGTLSQTEKTKLGFELGVVRNKLESMIYDTERAFAFNESLKPMLSEEVAATSSSVDKFLDSATSIIMSTQTSNISQISFFEEGTQSIASILNLSNKVVPALTMLLQNRIDGFARSKYIALTATSIMVLLALGAWLLIVRYVLTTVDKITNVFYRLTDGQFRNKIDLHLKDELGDLLRAIQGMQLKLNYDLADAREKAANALRVKQALDNVSANVMVADVGNDIIYMNHALKAMFKSTQDDIRKDIPDFNTESLMGENVDCLEQNTDSQKQWLGGLKETFKSSLVVGGQHLDVIADSVITEAGERTGTVVEWKNRTDEVKIENEIEEIVNAVKAGSLDQRIELAGKTGFVKKLSGEINELADTIENVFTDIQQVVNAMAEGDLTRKIDNEFGGIFAVCRESINRTQEKLSEVFGQISESSEFVRNSSQEIATGNNNLSQRAEEQAASLEQTASSMEQLTSTVKTNADNAQQANQVANSARDSAQKGGEIANKAVMAMDQINTSSNKIAEIIGVIDGIAFQTNLLALNASVEAARAGEQGRGFSVVATEVRTLAQRSATAAKESKELIKNSLAKVEQGSELVHETGEALSEIVGATKKVGDIVAEIAAASGEQSMGINQVNQAVSQMDEITQQNAALAEQASAASVSMSDQSKHMDTLLAFFKAGEVPGGSQQPVLGSPPEIVQPAARSSSVNRPVPAQRVSAGVSRSAVADNEDDWEEF